MQTQMKLGGNITLSGFEKVDKNTLFIVKKIVGNYAKKLSEQSRDFKALHVSLDSGDDFRVQATVTDPPHHAEAKEDCLVFALGTALNKVSESA